MKKATKAGAQCFADGLERQERREQKGLFFHFALVGETVLTPKIQNQTQPAFQLRDQL